LEIARLVVKIVQIAYIVDMESPFADRSSGRNDRRFRRAILAVRKRAERRRVERAKSESAEAGQDFRSALPGGLKTTILKRLVECNVTRLEVEEWVDWIVEWQSKAGELEQTDEASSSDFEMRSTTFSAGARARALLRGKDIAAKDLEESGGSYSLEEVRRLLNGVSRQSIERRVREGRLLAVIGRNNRRFYPVAQFNDDGAVVDGLRAVQDALSTRNGFAVLNFLVNPDSRLDNRKPIDLLKQGQIERVVEAAERIGEQGG